MHQAMRWVHPHKRRYYHAELMQDLLGDWIVVAVWGALDSNRGGSMQKRVESFEEGVALLRETEARRVTRGYHPQSYS